MKRQGEEVFLKGQNDVEEGDGGGKGGGTKMGREGGGGRRGRGREQIEKSSRSKNTKPAVMRKYRPRIPGDTGGDAAYFIVFI